MNAPPTPDALLALRDQWLAHWPAALAVWSKFTRLSEPRWCFNDADAQAQGLSGSFAMIRLTDQAVVIGLHLVAAQGIQRFATEVLAHEVGHHVYAPGDLTDHARTIARMRWALPTREHLAGYVANLYTDLLINNRLQRGSDLRMAEVYAALPSDAATSLWTFYMRIYELLWRLPTGSLARGELTDRVEGDAHLGARLIRSYARDWVDGAGRFAALCLPYLLETDDQSLPSALRGWRDMHNPGGDGMPHGLSDIEPGEKEGALHPSRDPELSGLDELSEKQGSGDPPQDAPGRGAGQGQARQPFEYGEILKGLGIKLSEHEAAIRYYRERAAPHLVRFPTRQRPQAVEPLAEGLEPWDTGSPLEEVDWMESVLRSPRVIAGVTTVQRVWGVTEGSEPRREPLDLDLYVDSSGSITNPQVNISYLTLAGAIIALSALRVGARVQATLWSGARQFQTTAGFVSNEHQILEILTGYIGGATAFPIHILRDTYKTREPTDRPVHILVISDDGVTTMFDKDENGNSGWDIARMALEKARGGGSMALNIHFDWTNNEVLARAFVEQSWTISAVRSWEDLVAFARQFSQMKYSGPDRNGA